MITLNKLAENAVVVEKGYFDKQTDDSHSAYIAGPVPSSLIEVAESELGMTFPSEYRSFLCRYGAMVATGVEISGIKPYKTDKNPFFLDVVTETKAGDHFPRGRYLVLSYDGMGVTFLLDTKDARKTTIIARGAGVEDLEVASSLDEFVDGMLKDTFAARINAASATIR